jgi:hypothetical protein
MEYPNKEKTNKVNRNLQHEKRVKKTFILKALYD